MGEDAIHIDQVTMSNPVELIGTGYTGDHSCYHTEGIDGEPAWWQGTFEISSLVRSIDLFNLKLTIEE